MAKSYNPFKMLGSWIGVSVPVLLFILSFCLNSCLNNQVNSLATYHLTCGPAKILLFPIYGIFGDNFALNTVSILAGYLGILIVWFLAGWGIHSLIRKFK